MLAYEATWAQNFHRSELGLHRFRVLTLTNSPECASHIIEAACNLERGHGLFLVTDAEALKAASDIIRHAWRTPRNGDSGTLMD